MRYMLVVLALMLSTQSVGCTETLSLVNLVRQTMQTYYEEHGAGIQKLLKNRIPKQYNYPAGVFVTLSTNGHTRACWGSIQPMYANLVESVVYTTVNALNKDYRCKPIADYEWKDLKPQVTVIQRIEPLTNIRTQNPYIDGLLIQAGSKSAILLPGEASDAHYQLVQCKLKAHIRPGEAYQLYRIKAKIYE